MTHQLKAEDLRQALAHVPVGARPSPDAPSPQQLWDAAHGELEPRQAQQIVDEAIADPVAWEEWRLLHALEQELAAEDEQVAANDDPAPGSSNSRRFGWGAAGLGILAAVVAVTVLQPREDLRPTDVDRDSATFREADAEGPQPRIEAGTALPRDAFELAWEAGPQGARYELQVSTDEPRLLVHERGLTEPRFLVPETILSHLPAGSRILWRVEEVRVGGNRRSATFVTPIR